METLNEWIDIAPWKSRMLLLIDLDSMAQANTLGDKRELLANANDHRLIAVWPGQWRTTARLFASGDVVRVAEVLG